MVRAEENPEKLNDFLKVSEAAAFLGVSVSTLRNWDRNGKLKAKRHPVNGYRLYSQSELQGVVDELLGSAERRGEPG